MISRRHAFRHIQQLASTLHGCSVPEYKRIPGSERNLGVQPIAVHGSFVQANHSLCQLVGLH